MWGGSAAEYRHEKANEAVCAECGAKRKDPCRNDIGNAVDGHQSRARLEMAIAEFERLQDRASMLGITIAEMRDAARKTATARAEAAAQTGGKAQP